jgi:2',3'-cyclic-nucleotide 2'-phosphodiesterase (5'-nucleotidase family)
MTPLFEPDTSNDLAVPNLLSRNRALRSFIKVNRYIPGILLSLFLSLFGSARTDTILILHTNDIHAHLRADYDGSGGLPYVSGYINQQRAERTDILVLDAGDVAEKGDLVAFATDCELVYEAMGRVGFDAGAPGNHDHDFGVPQLHRFAELADPMRMLCINLVDEDGVPEFPPSSIFEVDGVRVGVIGMIVPRDEYGLDREATAEAMAREAERLEPEVDLTIAVCHESSRHCANLSRIAPLIDVYISGHSHEVLPEAVVVPETGALIVQAGSYAEYVGRLELTIDLESETILEANSELVPMRHDVIPCDIDMLQWIREHERALTPEADRLVGWTDTVFDYRQLGNLGAAALRESTGADIAFCAPGQVIRATLPIGLVDVNAIFRTGGERAHHVIETRLTGSEIEAYLLGMEISDWYQTSWAGFRASVGNEGGKPVIQTNLDADRSYRVVIPELEWRTRFLRLIDRARKDPDRWNLALPEAIPEISKAETTFTDAVTDYLDARLENTSNLVAIIDEATSRTKL